MKNLIEAYKKIRKKSHLNQKYSGKYAFIGVGHHSINNLYPVLDYLSVPLKYILTRTSSISRLIGEKRRLIGTTNLDKILRDPEIKGIFICASPESHYDLVSKSLSNNKDVFVEKPPCQTLEELDLLISLASKKSKICFVGLQKRYSPCTKILKSKLTKNEVISYSYRFVTGAYPEGNPLLDLFIHPLDLITHLFGKAKIVSIVNTSGSPENSCNTIFLHVAHDHIVGNIELSTDYSWVASEENLRINCKSGVFEMKNHDSLTFQAKQKNIFSIPVEKVFPAPQVTKTLFYRNNFVPSFENNQLFTMGYYNELLSFISLCESRKASNLTPLEEVRKTFVLIKEIGKHV